MTQGVRSLYNDDGFGVILNKCFWSRCFMSQFVFFCCLFIC